MRVLQKQKIVTSICNNSVDYPVRINIIIESLSTHVFETRTATGREYFSC